MDIKNILKSTFSEAANSLTTLIQKPFSIQQEEFQILEGDQFLNELDVNPEDFYFASILPTPEKFNFSIFLVLPENSGYALFDFLMGNPTGTTTTVDEDVISGVGELTNIVGHTFINKMADSLHTNISATTPVTTFDMFAAIMEGAVTAKNMSDEKILYSKSHLISDDSAFTVQFFIIADTSSQDFLPKDE